MIRVEWNFNEKCLHEQSSTNDLLSIDIQTNKFCVSFIEYTFHRIYLNQSEFFFNQCESHGNSYNYTLAVDSASTE